MNLLAGLILVIQYLAPTGDVLAVNFLYDVPPERCEQLAQVHTNWEGEVRSLARCFETEPPVEQLMKRVEET